MAVRQIYCAGDSPQNTGWKKVCKNDIGAVVGLWKFPVGYEIATDTLALTESTWIGLVKNPAATRAYPFPACESLALTPKEATYRDTPFEGSKRTAAGLYGWEFAIDKHYSVVQRLKSHSGGACDVVLYTDKGQIIMTSDDGTKLKGFTVQSLEFNNDMFNDGAAGHLAKLKLILADAEEWDLRGWVAKPDDFNIKTIDGLMPVVHTATDITATGFTFSVISQGASADDPSAQWPALTAADIVFTTSAGVPVAKTIVDNGDGTYGIVATIANGNYLAGLVAPASISVAAYQIESVAQVAFTKA